MLDVETKEVTNARLSDEELVALLQENPKMREIQGTIYDRFSERIFFKCITFTKDRGRAGDFTHDIFIKIFTNIQKFKGNSKFSLWVHSITYNHCVSELGKKKEDYVGAEVYTDENISDDPDWIEIDSDPEVQELILRQSLEAMSAEDKMILLMKYWDDLRVEDIGKILNLENSAVKMRLKRARDRMKILMGKLKDLQK